LHLLVSHESGGHALILWQVLVDTAWVWFVLVGHVVGLSSFSGAASFGCGSDGLA